MSEWKAKVNGKEEGIEVQLDGEKLKVDGKELELDLISTGNGKFHILYQHRSYNASLLTFDKKQKKLLLKINNRHYDLELEDRFDQLLHRLGMDDLVASGISQIKAPMPGLVLNVLVKDGQEVSTDESLLILEAMKMENVIKSPVDGVIKSVTVKEQESVEKNQILIEFE